MDRLGFCAHKFVQDIPTSSFPGYGNALDARNCVPEYKKDIVSKANCIKDSHQT
jgi:hypothetical protein